MGIRMKSWRWTSTTGSGGEGFSQFYAVNQDPSLCCQGKSGVPTFEEDIVRSDSEREELWLLVVDVVLMLEMTSIGLVQAMQTQAHTQVTLQAQLEAQAPAPVPQEPGHGGPSIMERFKWMAPPSFKGESQPLPAESWMREIEKIFRAIRCAEEDKVSLATYMLQDWLCLSTARRWLSIDAVFPEVGNEDLSLPVDRPESAVDRCCVNLQELFKTTKDCTIKLTYNSYDVYDIT
ncbi:hypothetical protein Taro_052511 [Colocasia esculenta]|uniref:Uncharacterized protein n=1 Tax=Colocasia esculenta TaxID=4460 RepID=A0A843XKA8_COLES|nr:hypothetical protein [Colocasia esculenta]